MIRVEKYEWGYKDYNNCWISNHANSAGGVSVNARVHNYGEKAVKKYTVYFSAYNGADELAFCTINDQGQQGIISTDCVEPSKSQRLFGENLWYNYSVRRVEIDGIDVVYADGTTESCNGNYIPTQEEKQLYDMKVKTLKVVRYALLFCFLFLVYRYYMIG
ncbi:MAG: hypothetical protein K2O29_07950 [Ruminococcus sp.]|nr:hypothetical protein [Ruminococcus sp.]